MSYVKTFLNRLGTAAKKMDGSRKATKEVLETFESGIPGLDNVVKRAKVTRHPKHGFLQIADEPLSKFTHILKQGSLSKIIGFLTKSKYIPDPVNQKLFEKLVKATPEHHMFKIQQLADQLKKSKHYLDITADKIGDGITSASKIKNITTNAVKEIAQLEKRVVSWAKANKGKIALTIGVVVVGEFIVRNVAYRKGCFMMTTINGVVTSCKVASYSCASPSLIGKEGDPCLNSGLYNTTLVLMAITKLDDGHDLKKELASKLQIQPGEMLGKVKHIIDNQFDIVDIFLKTLRKDRFPNFSVCDPMMFHPDVEEGPKLPTCRMCSSIVSPTLTTYIDPSQDPEVSFLCNENPSILDIFADLAKNTYEEILKFVSNTLSSILKPIGIFLAVIIVLALIVMALFKMSKSNISDDQTPLIKSQF